MFKKIEIHRYGEFLIKKKNLEDRAPTANQADNTPGSSHVRGRPAGRPDLALTRANPKPPLGNPGVTPHTPYSLTPPKGPSVSLPQSLIPDSRRRWKSLSLLCRWVLIFALFLPRSILRRPSMVHTLHDLYRKWTGTAPYKHVLRESMLEPVWSLSSANLISVRSSLHW